MQSGLHTPVTQDMMVTWHKRLLNAVIDYIMIILVFVILGLIGALLSLMGYPALEGWISNIDGWSDRLLTTAVLFVYYFTIESTTQRSVGKYVTGTEVVTVDGSKPSPKAVLYRSLCRIITLEALSFLREYPRGWHDTASDTFVVDIKKFRAAQQLSADFEEIGTSFLKDNL